MTEFSAEDEERVLALLDDGTRASIATMFMGRATTHETINMDQLMEMMTELQVAYDTDIMPKIVPEDEWDSLTLHQCNIAIARFIEMAQKHVAEQQKVENAVIVAQTTTPIVYLDTLDYLILHTPCGTKEEGVEYRWNKIKLDIRPKTILMVSVATMMVIVAAALIVVIIALNEHVTHSQVENSLEQFGITTDVTSHTLLGEGIRLITATFLKESSRVVAQVFDGLLLTRRDVVMEELQNGLHSIKNALGTQTQLFIQDEKAKLSERALTISTVFFDTGSLDNLYHLLEDWSAEYQITAFTGSFAFFTSLSCQINATNDCFRASNGTDGSVLDGEYVGCGVPYFWASVFLPRLGTSVCFWKSLTDLQSAAVSRVDSVVTEVNLVAPETSLELQVAIDTKKEFMSIGGRKKLPILCARNDQCEKSDEIFSQANLTDPSERPVTAVVKGYDLAEWLASFGKLFVSNMSFLLGLKINLHEDREDFYSTLFSSSILLSNNTPATVFAVADELERVQILPLNSTTPSISQERYLNYALNKRFGVSYADFQELSSIMAGYAPASEAQLGIGMQLPASGVSNLTTAVLIAVLQEQNSHLPPGRELLVFRKGEANNYEFLLGPKISCGLRCKPHGAAEEAFSTQGSGIIDTYDHNGEKVLAWYNFFEQQPPIVIVAQVSQDEIQSDILERRYIAIGVGCLIVLTVQLIILVLTQRVLDKIENDYNKYKRHIEEEKHQFSELVKDVMPPYIAEKIMKGTRLIAETHPQLTLFFSDIVGSTETTKVLTNKYLVRMLGYTFMLEDEIASHYGVHKIKTIGDAYFAVAGLEDSTGGAASGKEHQVYRMVSFACICQQLFGPGYSHFPERTECFRISAGNQDMGPMKMVRMRMGIHTGPAIAGVVDVGRAPHFDCFGPSVNLASRMESTSTAGRVQISGPTKEILAKLDKEGLFEFEAPRKTLVKGYGTMVTYLIKSTNLHVPEELIAKLHIERAQRRQYFNAQGEMIKKEETTSSKKSSEGSAHGDVPKEQESPSKPVEPPPEDLSSLLPGLQPLPSVGPSRPPQSKQEDKPSQMDFPDFAAPKSLPPPPPPNF